MHARYVALYFDVHYSILYQINFYLKSDERREK
jgi:hypothetical protein